MEVIAIIMGGIAAIFPNVAILIAVKEILTNNNRENGRIEQSN